MKRQKTITVIGFAFIIFLLLFYNHERSMGYNFDITDKNISYNLIPFKNLKYIITNHLGRVVTKLLFFVIIGAIFSSMKHLKRNNNFRTTVFMISITSFVEIIHIFTGYSVCIDINNWIVYVCGMLIGCIITNTIFSILKTKKISLS